MRKKLISMGLVSALGASTSVMAIDLDSAAKDTPDIFAAGTADKAGLAAGGTTPLTGLNLVETTEIGFGIAEGQRVYIRFDLEGAEFTTDVAIADLNVGASGANGTGTAIAQGGDANSSFVIFDVTSNTGSAIQQDTEVGFTPNVGSDFATSSASVEMSIYSTPEGATGKTGELYSIDGTFASFVEGLDVEVDTQSDQAEVTTGFTLFGASNIGELGNVALTIDPNGILLNSAAAGVGTIGNSAYSDFADLANTTITLNGDVSFGDWYLEDGGCTGVANADVDLVEDTDTFDNAANVADPAWVAGNHYSVCVDVDGTEVINAGAYTIDFEFATGTRPAPISDTSDSVGSITRNGTTVQIPYLSTFEDYNQRLVIVNRGAVDAAYSLTFTSEDGVTATAGDAATGTVPAGEVLSIKASDIVTLAGKTRTAATLLVVAPSANIDVATNQVNLSDGSTDTVVY